jgi:hypothetical protein
VVDHRLVLIGDVRDSCRQREHDMEIPYRQEFGFALGQPLACGSALTLGAVPIAATNGRRPLLALWADPVMGSWRRADRVFEQVAASPLSITKYA